MLTILLTAIATVLLTVIAMNFATPEKKLDRKLEHKYTAGDPQFRREMGLMFGPGLLSGNAVEDLQNDRNVPVYLLNELVRQTPEGVFLTSIRQSGQVIAITGIAQTNERVSEFLRNTLYNSTWLEKPDLVEIKAASAAAGTRDQRRLFDFSMRVTIKRQQAPAPSASAQPVAVPAPAKAS